MTEDNPSSFIQVGQDEMASSRPRPAGVVPHFSQVTNIINESIDRDVIQFLFPDPHHRPVDGDRRLTSQNPVSRVELLFSRFPPRNGRPISRRCDQAGETQTLFGSADVAPRILDIEYLCREAFNRYEQLFHPSVCTCCTRVCVATLATGSNPRFFAVVQRAQKEMSDAKNAVINSAQLIHSKALQRHRDTIGANQPLSASNLRENVRTVAKKYLPILLGQKRMEGVSGKLCVFATKRILGVSLSFIYKRRVVDEDITSLIDISGARSKSLRRTGIRDGRSHIESLRAYQCRCIEPCFEASTSDHLQALFSKFETLSRSLRPYEKENEFLIDLLYCPLLNSDTEKCNRSIAELLHVSVRRVARARAVVHSLVESPSLFLNDQIAPVHGMYEYSSKNHPMTRISTELREAIAQSLDLTTRADPAAEDGSVTYRFYDPSVNSYEKIQRMLHESMSETLTRNDIGDLSSTTFRRIFAEYLEERDGRLSLARADHNCCPYCQELELAVHALEMEIKSMSPHSQAEVRTIRNEQLEVAKRELDEHVGWDKMVRGHLGKLVALFQAAENEHRNSAIRESGEDIALRSCPAWCSKTDLVLMTHQDDMTKANIPYFTRESLSVLTRYRYDVTAHVSAVTGSATVFSHEQGCGLKNSGTIFESVLLDHFLTCRGEKMKFVWSDCASVGRSFFSCVACAQYLVESGFCDFVLFGFMANCHGKYLADSLFGQWRRRARNADMASVDAMLDLFEKVKRAGGEEVRGIILNPVSSINWQENLARLGYGVHPPPEFGWEAKNPHYACACRGDFKDNLSAQLKGLLEPLMPVHEHCVRISSWPYFGNPDKPIPFEHRPVDVPAAALKPRKTKGHPITATKGADWYLSVPSHHNYSATGDGVVARATAEIVGHNSSRFANKVALLKSRNKFTEHSWPEDMELPPDAKDIIKVAPENWIARRTVMHMSKNNWIARYPPLNLVNALDAKPPREQTERHKCTATYKEPPFPVFPGTCAYNAASQLERSHGDRLEKGVHILELYMTVRLEMGVDKGDETDEFLQPRAKMASNEAIAQYRKYLSENKARNRKRPGRKKTAYQCFRSDSVAKQQMKDILEKEKWSGNTNATLVSVSAEFWEKCTSEYKRRFEEKSAADKQRYEMEYADFLAWQRVHDSEREAMVM